MRLSRPPAALAGYHAQTPTEGVPELIFFGDRWTAAGFGIADHHHPVWEFYLQVAGRSFWHLPHAHAKQGDTLSLQEGDFWVVAPGTPHRMVEAHAKQHFLYAAIDLEPIWARYPDLHIAWQEQRAMWHVAGAGSLGAPFRHLGREVAVSLAHRAIGVRLALDLLVTEATRLIGRATERSVSNSAALGSAAPAIGTLAEHPAVAQARELLEHQPGRAWTLGDLARLTGLSPNHLAERFARDVGVPPHQFLLQTRAERAKALLRDSDAPITHIALELGFASGQHFAATFKRLTGQTAREWRNKAAHSQAQHSH